MDHQEQETSEGVGRSIRRRWRLVVVCSVLGLGAALAWSLVQAEKYTSEVSLLFRDPGFDQNLFGTIDYSYTDPAREAATNVALVSLDTVAELTAKKLGPELGPDFTSSDVSNGVTVLGGGQSDVVTVSVEDEDPETAALIANVFAKSYVNFRRDADRAQVENARQLVDANIADLTPEELDSSAGRSLQRQLSELTALEALQTGNAERVQKAEPASNPSSPRVKRNAVLGGLLGLLLGCALAILVERLDRRLREPKEFESAFGLPLLATIPERRSLERSGERMEQLLDSDSETLRMLRARLRYFNVDHEINSVLVTSAAAGDGKTTVAWTMAVSAARTGSRTLFVEADLRRPTVAQRENLAPIPGLAELLTAQAEQPDAIQKVAVNVEAGDAPSTPHVSVERVARRIGPGENTGGIEIDVIVAGTLPPNAGELLESARMAGLVGSLTEQYDLLVIDTPPIAVVSDAIPLLQMVDGAIIVARSGATTRDEAEELRAQLEALSAPALGVIVNRAKTRKRAYGYDYYHRQSPE